MNYKAIVYIEGKNTSAGTVYEGSDLDLLFDVCASVSQHGARVGAAWFPPAQISMIRLFQRPSDAPEAVGWLPLTDGDPK